MTQQNQSPTKLQDKVAIVTGASRGIGRSIALGLSRAGAIVVVNYATNALKANEVVETIQKEGGKAIAIQADMGDISQIHRLFDLTQEQFGRLDILVNNAGVSKVKTIDELTEKDYDQMFAVNTKGALFALQAASRQMADGGRIINISSGGTNSTGPGFGVYTGSKAALEQFTMSLAKEIGGRGITVNAILPGLTETDMYEEVAPPQVKHMALHMTPLGRLGQSEDIADVVVFLASEEARWITGQRLTVSGGL